MQYSLKWILAAMAYVALAAAAFGQGAWYLANLLWIVSLLAVMYAIGVACYVRGKGQAEAVGFIVASGCFLACLAFGGVPTARLLTAVGVKQSVPIPPYAGYLTPVVNAAPSSRIYPPPLNVPGPSTPNENFPIYLRAANAIGMMLFGLAGCVLGALAYRAVGAKSSGIGRNSQ